MRWNEKRIELGRVIGVSATLMLAPGCASPPSVAPLLEASRAVVAREAARVREEAALDAAQADATRRAMSAAYDADIEARIAGDEGLDPQWVREATAVLVEAREAVTRHEAARLAERERRAADLESAASATARAVRLLEQRDRLLAGPGGWDVWRWIYASDDEDNR